MKTGNLFKSAAIYSIGNISNKVIGFILLPLYTTHLTTTDYGILDLLLISGLIATTFLSFRLPSATIRWCSENQHQTDYGKIIFTSFLFLVSIAVCFSALAIPLANNLSQWFFTSPTSSTLIHYLIYWVALEVIIDLPMQVLRLEEKALQYTILSLLKLAVILSLNIYFVAYAQIGVEGILISQLVGSALLLLLTLPFLFKRFEFKFKRSELWRMLLFSYPMVFSSLFSLVLTYSDRFVFTYYDQIDTLGTYSLGFRLASIIQVVIISSFQLSFTPIAYLSYEKENFTEFFNKTLVHYGIVLGFCVSGVALLGGDSIRFLIRDDQFLPALSIIPILAFFFYFKGLQFLFTITLHLKKQTKYLINIVFLGLLVNTPLNFILIPIWGLHGAAISTLFASIIGLLYAYYLSKKFLTFDYPIRRLIKISLLTFFLVILSIALFPVPIHWRIIVSLFAVLSFPYFIWQFKILNNEQLKEFWQKALARIKG